MSKENCQRLFQIPKTYVFEKINQMKKDYEKVSESSN